MHRATRGRNVHEDGSWCPYIPQASHCTSSVRLGLLFVRPGLVSRAGRDVLWRELWLGERLEEFVGILRSRVLVALMRVPLWDVIVDGVINAL